MKKINYSDLIQMMSINSWTKNKLGVDENGELMKNWLLALGMQATVFSRKEIGDHLLMTSPHVPGMRRLLLLGHLDTVFPPKSFEQVTEDEYWIYGPGACDMKGGNFVALSALRHIYQTYGSIQNIDFLLVSDEESGSDDSKSLTQSLAEHYSACIDFEAAGESHEVVIGRKGVATYHLTIQGKAAHAGNHFSNGIDANLAAATILLRLASMTDLEKGTTVNVGKMKGGIGANTISPHAELVVEARFTHQDEQRRITETLPLLIEQHGIADLQVTLSGGLQRNVMIPTPEQNALLATYSALLGYPLKTEHRGGVSDANVVAGMGVPTLDGFGPFGDGDHTRDERVSKASIIQRIEEVTKILAYYTSK